MYLHTLCLTSFGVSVQMSSVMVPLLVVKTVCHLLSAILDISGLCYINCSRPWSNFPTPNPNFFFFKWTLLLFL